MMLLLLLLVVMFVKICVAISELSLHYCELLLQCRYLNGQLQISCCQKRLIDHFYQDI